jgi:hypothetical protein
MFQAVRPGNKDFTCATGSVNKAQEATASVNTSSNALRRCDGYGAKGRLAGWDGESLSPWKGGMTQMFRV